MRALSSTSGNRLPRARVTLMFYGITWHDRDMQTSSAPTLGATQCHASSGHSRPNDNNWVCFDARLRSIDHPFLPCKRIRLSEIKEFPALRAFQKLLQVFLQEFLFDRAALRLDFVELRYDLRAPQHPMPFNLVVESSNVVTVRRILEAFTSRSAPQYWFSSMPGTSARNLTSAIASYLSEYFFTST